MFGAKGIAVRQDILGLRALSICEHAGAFGGLFRTSVLDLRDRSVNYPPYKYNSLLFPEPPIADFAKPFAKNSILRLNPKENRFQVPLCGSLSALLRDLRESSPDGSRAHQFQRNNYLASGQCNPEWKWIRFKSQHPA
jgi:hypothetical protein